MSRKSGICHVGASGTFFGGDVSLEIRLVFTMNETMQYVRFKIPINFLTPGPQVGMVDKDRQDGVLQQDHGLLF